MGICGSKVPYDDDEGDECDEETKEEDRQSFDLESMRHNSSYANLIPIQRNSRVEGNVFPINFFKKKMMCSARMCVHRGV